MQKFTSAATSINSARLPAVFRKINPVPGSVLLDIGCGRYVDHIRSALHDVVYLPYDPYNQPHAVNALSVRRLWRTVRHGTRPVSVVCSNVLNVIDDDGSVSLLAAHIQDVVNRSGGIGYVTVYEGNRSGTGCQTGPDQWQRNEPLRSYLRFFAPSAYVRNNMIIIIPEV